MVIVVPAICNETRSPFRETTLCRSHALFYSSFSMAVKLRIILSCYKAVPIFLYIKRLLSTSVASWFLHLDPHLQPHEEIWRDTQKNGRRQPTQGRRGATAPPGNLYCWRIQFLSYTVRWIFSAFLLQNENKLFEDEELKNFFTRLRESALQIAEELMSPPTVGVVWFSFYLLLFLLSLKHDLCHGAGHGFIFGATPWQKSMIIDVAAPFRVVYESINLMGYNVLVILLLHTGSFSLFLLICVEGSRMGRYHASLSF